MIRRTLLVPGAAALLLCLASASLAQDFAASIAAQLGAQGYRSIETERTWLGRLRITATKGGAEREIILNPRTGEVLRDLLLRTGGSSPGILDDDDQDGGSGSNSGSGSDDDADDSDDDSGSDDDSSDDDGSDDSGSDDSGSDGSGGDDD